MRLESFPLDPRERDGRLKELAMLLDQPSSRESRPCPGCTIPCPCSRSRNCTCPCNPGCPQAPSQMSSDGERYPIEPGIVGLVFAFNGLRLCPPYWSCEGHLDQRGAIHRVPQVWFYSVSPLYARLIAETVGQLYFQRKIVDLWHVCVTYCEEALQTGYSLEPDVKSIERVDLARLQSDATVIAGHLEPCIRRLTVDILSRCRVTN